MRSSSRSLALALLASLALATSSARAQDPVAPAGDGAAPSEALAAPPAPAETTPRQCQNGADDDGDGAVDCDDSDCRMLIFCVSRPRTEEDLAACTNEVDDDGDGRLDCADDGCAAHCTTGRPGQPGTTGLHAPRRVEPLPELGVVEHDDPRRYPARYTARPLTYLSGMLVPRLGLSVRDVRATDPLVQLGLGLTYGILDLWEITILPVPLSLAPVFDYENPALSTTFRFFSHEVVELGVLANVAIPVGTAGSLGAAEPLPTHHLLARSRYSDSTHLDLALLVRLHLGDHVRLDLDLPVMTLVITGDDARADLTFDAQLSFSPLDYLYLGVFTGAVIPGPTYEDPKIPLGFFVGGTIPGSRRGPLVDLMLRFGWPLFWDDAPPPGVDDVSADYWQLTFDVQVHTYLLP